MSIDPVLLTAISLAAAGGAGVGAFIGIVCGLKLAAHAIKHILGE